MRIAYSDKNLSLIAQFLAPRYAATDWEWMCYHPKRIPDVSDIISTFNALIASVKGEFHRDERHHIISTGGVFVECSDSGKLFIGVDASLRSKKEKVLCTYHEWKSFVQRITSNRMRYLRPEKIKGGE
jgi:hypothetical protein